MKTRIKKDYSLLPRTRKEQLDDILHTDWSLIVKLSLFNLLFSLPLFISLFMEYYFLSSLSEFTLEKVFPICFYMGLISLIGFGLRGVGKFATASLLKKRAFNEGYILLPRLLGYVKENFFKGFASYFLLGVSYMVLTLGSVFFLYQPMAPYLKGLGIGICIFYFILRFVATSYSEHLNALYVLSFPALNKNSYSFTFLTFLYSLLYFVICFILPVGLGLISLWLIIAVILIYGLFFDGFLSLIACLFSLSKFDKYINQDNYPTFVNKGLRKEENKEEVENVEIITQENL